MRKASPRTVISFVGVPSRNPDPFTAVSCANIGSGKHSPCRIKPQFGQVSENSTKPPKSESWAVLHKCESRSYLANDAGHFSPQSALVSVKTFAVGSAIRANVLARESARHHVNSASPRSAVKGSHVIPDREGRKASVVLAGQKNIAGVWVKLDGADGSPPEEMPPENAATSACEKCQLIHDLLQIRNAQQSGREYAEYRDSHP